MAEHDLLSQRWRLVVAAGALSRRLASGGCAAVAATALWWQPMQRQRWTQGPAMDSAIDVDK